MAFIPHGHPDREKNLARFLDGNHEEVPDVAFHGTMDDFSQFKYESPTRVSRGLNRFGFWFDKNEKTPNYFAGYAQPSESRKPNVIAAHISMKNPLIFASDEIHPELQDKINEMAKRQDWNGINGLLAQKGHDDAFDKLMRLLPNGGRTRDEVVDQIKQQIMDDGYDGIILKNTMADHKTRGGRPTDWYLPFRSEQIKSAFGNQGTFDPNDPDITKAGGGEVESGAFSPVPGLEAYHEDPAFQEWFGDSVTHREGVPVTYYTGTSKDVDFSKFNVGRHGAWFTADPSEANGYAERNDSQGYKRGYGWEMIPTNTASRVIPVHLKIENPYTGPLPESVLSGNYKKAQSDWFDTLRAKGHDGWIPEQYGGQLAVVLKEPHQIKSVNNRAWDPKNPRMDKAQGGEVIPHGHPEREKNFRQWFGKSKLVDKEGNPLVLYHGTDKDFSAFDPEKHGSSDHGWYGVGHYMTAHPVYASAYAEQRSFSDDIKGNVMPVHARLENPYVWPQDRPVATSLEEAKKLTEELIRMGHDGVIAPNDYEEGLHASHYEVVAFHPEQIKSATGNRGTFDPNDPDITKAQGGEVDDDGITAYHGSPHDFDQFMMDKIGTGEGAQAYGHGLYTAEAEPIAQEYRDRLSGHDLDYEYDPSDEKYYVTRRGKEVEYVADSVEDAEEYLSMRQKPGHMYEVRINAHPDHFLDWEKPLSEQGGVKKFLTLPDFARPLDDNEAQNVTGQTLYNRLEIKLGPQKAARALHSAGIPGIKYLDAGSRGAGEGSRNYVVFDDKLVDVKRKYAAGGVVKESSDGKEAREDRAAHGRSRRKTPLIIDQYPTQYVPHVGRQVMQTGGSAIVKRALELTSQRRQRGR